MYNSNYHHRRSIRLKDYDYSQEGLYFVTICTQNRECLFWEVIDSRLDLTLGGKMIEKWLKELKNKFIYTKFHEYIIMPNHVHAIIEIVGADLCVCPNPNECTYDDKNNNYNKEGEHTGSPLHHIIQWFKTMTTNEYIKNVKESNWPPFNKKLWQRNYYEHIVRNECELQKIIKYIIYNPQKWEMDEENPGNLKL